MKLHLVTLATAVLITACSTFAENLTSVSLGDPASERANRVVAQSAPDMKVTDFGLDQPHRRLKPEGEGRGASIAFDARVDPVAQNHLTLKLWGGDSTWTPVNLVLDEDGTELGNLWWHVTREPPVPGRFLYRTFPIPIEVTRGKTHLRLRLQSVAAPLNPGAFRNADAPKPQLVYQPSFGIFALHTHVDPWFEVPDSDLQGKPFKWGPPATPVEGGLEAHLMKRARADIARALSHNVLRSQYGTGHRHDTRVLETLSLIHNTPWSGHYRERALAERIRDAIDIHVKRQADQGGDPGTMFYRGWGSHGRIANAFQLIAETFEQYGWLEEPLQLKTNGNSAPPTRRQAYGDFFHDAFEWRRLDRRSFTNQPIYVADTLYSLQMALRALRDERALSRIQSLRYVHEAFGLAPLRSREFAIDSGNANYPYRLITRAGLTREKGYVDGYGELTYVITRLAERTGDPAALDLARSYLHTRSLFRIPSNDTQGRGILRGIGAISWRGTTFPFRAAYSGVEEAAVLEDPVALRLAQLELAHGRLDLLPAEPERGPHWHPSDSIRMVEHYRKIKDLPASPHRLPTEPGQPDFTWSDPESGVFVFKKGDTLAYGSFFNIDQINGRGVGGRGVCHVIHPTYERLIDFVPRHDGPDSGLSITLKHPFGERVYPQVPPPPGMPRWQEEPPQAMDHRAGRAYFYHIKMGPYLIAMNTTETDTYRTSTWNLPTAPEVRSGRDLATGETVMLSTPLAVPPYTTRFLAVQ